MDFTLVCGVMKMVDLRLSIISLHQRTDIRLGVYYIRANELRLSNTSRGTNTMYEMFIICATVLGTLLILQEIDRYTERGIYIASAVLGMVSILGLVVVCLSYLLHVVMKY